MPFQWFDATDQNLWFKKIYNYFVIYIRTVLVKRDPNLKRKNDYIRDFLLFYIPRGGKIDMRSS